MKKSIEITPMAVLGMVPTAGFYEINGMLYVAMAPNVQPMYCGMVGALTLDASAGGQTGGVSEQTLLRAIAIVQRPDLAQALVGP